MHEAGIRLQKLQENDAAARAESLAALPTGTVVAVFANRADASAAAVQLLTTQPATCLWLRSGRSASAAIRAARLRRSFAMKVLRGFGDEELRVREVLRHCDDGGSVLVIRDGKGASLETLHQASHVYQFGMWSVRPLR
jgi:hypothetical protein